MNVGLLQVNDPAHFIVIDNTSDFNVLETYINGKLVAKNGKTFIESVKANVINNFNCMPISVADIAVPALSENLKVITVQDGQLITKQMNAKALVKDGFVQSDINQDVLKLVVVNRYNNAPPALAFVHNFGLKEGALASTVAHDSHNIIATGVE